MFFPLQITAPNQFSKLYMPIHIWAQMVKNLPTMQEIWVLSLGQEDPLEKGMATHSSILAWRTPWTDHGITELDTTEQLPHTHTPLSPFPPHLHLISIFTSIFIFISILPTEWQCLLTSRIHSLKNFRLYWKHLNRTCLGQVIFYLLWI